MRICWLALLFAAILVGCGASAPVVMDPPDGCASVNERQSVLEEARIEYSLGVFDDTFATLETCARHFAEASQRIDAYRLLALYHYYELEDQGRADDYVSKLLALDRDYQATGSDRPYFREGVNRLRPKTLGQKVGAFVTSPWTLSGLGLTATGAILCATEVLAACRPDDLPSPRVPLPPSP